MTKAKKPFHTRFQHVAEYSWKLTHLALDKSILYPPYLPALLLVLFTLCFSGRFMSGPLGSSDLG